MANVPPIWTNIDSTQVAPNAPVSTTLMTEIVGDLNYLSNVAGSANITVVTAAGLGSYTPKTSQLYCIMLGGGGSGGEYNAANGNVGQNTYVGNTGVAARGGNGGNSLSPGSAIAAAWDTAVPGALGIQAGSPANGGTPAGGQNYWGSGAGLTAGTAGTANSGGGGASNSGSGNGGNPGEYAQWWITVTPGTPISTFVGSGGAGVGGSGAGGSGIIIIFD